MILTIPRAQAGEAGRIALGVLAAAAVAGVLLMSPARASTILVLGASGLVVAIRPKLAYFLLPVTIPWGSDFSVTSGTVMVTPSDIIVAALLAGWCIEQTRVRRLDLPVNRWTVALTFLLLAMAVSTWQATSLGASAKELIKWTEVLVVTSLAPAYIRSRRDLLTVVLVTISAAGSEALLGLGQSILHSGPHAFAARGGFLRAYGTFGQPNPMAGYLNMVLPLAAATAWALRKAWLAGLAVLIGLGSLVTLSRSGWVAGGIALLIVVLFYVPQARPLTVAAGLAGLVTAVLMALSVLPIAPLIRAAASFGITAVNFQHHTHANFSEIERAAHWVAGLKMFEAHPFLGVGIGNYPVVYHAYHVGSFLNPLGHAHNYFINIAAESGILGLFAFTIFVVAGASYAFSTARAFRHDALLAALGIGVTGLWVSSTVHNLFDVLYVHELPLLLAVLMGTVIAIHRHAEKLVEVSAGRTDTDMESA